MSGLSKCGTCRFRELPGSGEPCEPCLGTPALARWEPVRTGTPPKHTDTDRLEWALPIVSGDDTPTANARTRALAQGLLRNLTGRALLDYAMGEAP